MPGGIQTRGLQSRKAATNNKIQGYSAGNCVACTNPALVVVWIKECRSVKLEGEKPLEKKQWSNGG